MKKTATYFPLVALLLAACATPSGAPVVALSGRVVAMRQISPTQGKAYPWSVSPSGMVGAAIVAGLNSSSGFNVYTVQYGGGRKEVNSFANVPVGECVDVLVPPEKRSVGYVWEPSEVTLRKSATCPAGDIAPQPTAAAASGAG
jgi:hypothetical protein